MNPTINITEYPPQTRVAAAIGIALQGFKVDDDIELEFWEDDDASFDPDIKSGSIQRIGSIKGKVVPFRTVGTSVILSVRPTSSTSASKTGPTLSVIFEQADGATPLSENLHMPQTAADAFEGDFWEVFATANAVLDDDKTVVSVTSTTTLIARVRRALTVGGGNGGEATYHFYQGHNAEFFHDGATNAKGTDGYFAYLRRALVGAKDFIFISDWSFHPLFRPDRLTAAYQVNDTIGYQLIDKANKNPEMLIAIHAWDHTGTNLPVAGVIGAPDLQNDESGDYLDEIAKNSFGLARRPANLLWIKSSRTGFGFSHHQKFVVCDLPPDPQASNYSDRTRVIAFLGGLDLTKGRFDWGDHTILPDEAGADPYFQQSANARSIRHDDWYNAELFDLESTAVPAGSSAKPDLPRQPWHDVAVAVMGPSAYDVVREFVGRWLKNPANWYVSGDTGHNDLIIAKFKSLFSRTVDNEKPYHPKTNPLVYAQQWQQANGPWSVQLCRSIERDHWEQASPIAVGIGDHTRREFKWTVNGRFERSIQLSYLQAIRQASDFIYIETQYFISSGSMWNRGTVANVIAINLAQRAIEQAKAGQPFHIYLIIPMFPEGSPGDAANGAQRQFQWSSIRAMATMIQAQTGEPWEKRLSVFFVARWNDLGGLPSTSGARNDNIRANRRYQIYVHSKFMMVDDRYIFIGSANLNERSLAGDRDSEIGVAMWPSTDATAPQCRTQARALREDLWREHLSKSFPEASFTAPGSTACIDAVRAAAAENYRAFREGRFDPAKHGHLCLWPIEADPSKPPMKASPDPAATRAPETDSFIPDRPFGLSGATLDSWRWDAPGPHKVLGGIKDLAAPGESTAE